MDLSRCTLVDYETSLIAPGNILPPPAIATTYHCADGARLWKTADLPRMWECLLDDAERGGYIGGHDIARFDLPVTCQHMPWLRPRIWHALEQGRIYDTLTAERIIEINRGQRGSLGLDMVALKHGLQMKAKAESRDIRLSFGQFIGADVIPPAHAEYALTDAVVPHHIAQRQLATGLVDQADVAMLARQTFWLAHVSARGFRTELEHVRKLDELVGARIAELEDIAREFGFLRTDSRGEVSVNKTAVRLAIACDYAGVPYAHPDAAPNARGKVTKKAIDLAWKAALAAVELNPRVPRTEASDSHPNGQVKTDRLTLEDAESIELQALAEWDQLKYIRNKDLKIFFSGVQQPVHTRMGITNTLRAISSEPQCHNFGKREGVRECIRAREGFALLTSDFRMGELVSLAQLCKELLGLDNLASKLRAGVDIHAEIGADVLGIADAPGAPAWKEVERRRKAGDKVAGEARDAGKPANFGCNGGMTDPRTFALYARKSYGQVLVERREGESVQDWNARRVERAAQIMAAWRGRADDQQAWIRLCRSQKNAMGLFDMKLPRTQNIWRRGLRLTEKCNNPFQALLMRFADRAGWKVAKAQYCTGEMHGAHLVMFTHDDLTSEVPLDKVAEYTDLKERLMCEALREVCPSVFDDTTPRHLMVDSRVLTHLSKGAKATKDADGRMAVTAVAMPVSLDRK